MTLCAAQDHKSHKVFSFTSTYFSACRCHRGWYRSSITENEWRKCL